MLSLLVVLTFQDTLEDLKRALAERRTEALERLEENKRELASQTKAEQEAADALRKRLAGKTITLTPRAGAAYANAAIRGHSMSDIEFEAGGKTLTLPWDTFQPASILAAADLLFAADSAQQQHDRGRFLVARRLFAEAKTALQKAVKLDDGLESSVQEIVEALDKLVAGKGDFHGAVKRSGSSLELSYDWKGDDQVRDWAGQFTVTEGTAVLEDEGKALSMLRTEFKDPIDVEIRLATDTPVMFGLLVGRTSSWHVVIGNDAIAIHRLEEMRDDPWDLGRELARSKTGLAKGKAHDIVVSFRDKKIRVLVDKKEAVSAPEAATGSGILVFRLEKGKAVFGAPFRIRGTVDPAEIDKRFAEAEILVRRAIDPDLKDVAEARERSFARRLMSRGEQMQLTADHPYFLKHLIKELTRYGDAKKKLSEYLETERGSDALKKELNALVAAYPQVASLRYLRALFFSADEETSDCAADVGKALELFPEFTEALILQARLHDDENEFDAALASAEKALQASPDSADAYVQRAIAGYAKDPSKREQWMQDLRIARQLAPSNRAAGRFLRALRYQARGPRDLGCRFVLETAHYVVMSDISDAATRSYADKLEAVYNQHYCELFKRIHQERPFPKPRVAVFNTRENYLLYDELLSETPAYGSAGLFMHRYNELILFETTDTEDVLDTLFHEGFHHFTMLMTKRTPAFWWNEGIAEYIACIRLEGGKVVERGRVQKHRLERIQKAVSKNTHVPFDRIMTMTPGQFYGDMGLHYAQAWSMLHFFYEYEKGRHRPLIERYFDQARAGRTIRECFDAVFKDNWKDLQKQWEGHVKALK